MKASEALELTNKAREQKKMERRPALDEIMPWIYEQISAAALEGNDHCYIDIGENNKNLKLDAIDQLCSDGFSLEWSNSYKSNDFNVTW